MATQPYARALRAASRARREPRQAALHHLESTELVATAVANAESRAELTASRARVVAAADETRRLDNPRALSRGANRRFAHHFAHQLQPTSRTGEHQPDAA